MLQACRVKVLENHSKSELPNIQKKAQVNWAKVKRRFYCRGTAKIIHYGNNGHKKIFFGAFHKNNLFHLFLNIGVWPKFVDFSELWQPLFSKHPVWMLAVSCQKLSPMHLEAELFLIVNKTFWDAELISTLV